MFDHHGAHEDLSQPDATRPPQLNQTVCGCRCGRGIGSAQEGDDGNKDGDCVSTLVGSEDSDSGDGSVSFSGDTALNASFEGQIRTPVPSEYVTELRARIERFLNGADGFQHLVSVDISSHLPGQNDFLHDFDADSMRPEPSSDVHSVVTSDARSVRPMSPGPGIGEWVEEGSNDYHFLARPLRLTPQHRCCRGLVASHVVLRDEEAFVAREIGLRGDGHLQEA